MDVELLVGARRFCGLGAIKAKRFASGYANAPPTYNTLMEIY